VQGFEVHHVETQMKYSDFKDEAIIENVYIRELEKYVKGALGAKEVRGLDFQVSPHVLVLPPPDLKLIQFFS